MAEAVNEAIKIIKTKKGTEVTITVDLNKMTFSNASEKIEFADNNSVTAFYYNLMTSITKFKDKLYSEYDEYIKNGGDKEQFKHDYAKDFNEWKAKADAAADEKQKAYYYWAIANVVSNKLDKEMSALMLKYFTPVHPIWSEKGQYLFHFISLPLLTKEEQLDRKSVV